MWRHERFSTHQGCQGWLKIGSDWPELGQILDFLRPVFSIFWRHSAKIYWKLILKNLDPKSSETDLKKSHICPISGHSVTHCCLVYSCSHAAGCYYFCLTVFMRLFLTCLSACAKTIASLFPYLCLLRGLFPGVDLGSKFVLLHLAPVFHQSGSSYVVCQSCCSHLLST